MPISQTAYLFLHINSITTFSSSFFQSASEFNWLTIQQCVIDKRQPFTFKGKGGEDAKDDVSFLPEQKSIKQCWVV